MKMPAIRKMVIFPILGIFLLVGSCTAQKQSAESPEAGQKDETETMEQQPMALNKDSSYGTHPALDFTLDSINGKKVSLTDFLGNKIVLMNFWASWCPYCITEIPHLNKIETSLADQVKVLSIDILEKSEKVKSMVKQKGIKFDVLLDQKGEVARMYRVRGTPTNIVIDKKGNIAYYGYELPKAEQVITNLIQK